MMLIKATTWLNIWR